VAEFDMMHTNGISFEGDILDMGVEQKILVRSGAWFKYNDAYIGQGKEKARAYLAENTAIRDEIRDKILASGVNGQEVAPEPGEEDEGSPDE
jgi:recombination protein RecA